MELFITLEELLSFTDTILNLVAVILALITLVIVIDQTKN